MSDRKDAQNGKGHYYMIPLSLLDAKYHGCGNGRIVVALKTDRVLDMDYLDEDNVPIYEQNIEMHPLAGEVLAETQTTITYRANFSCCTACLF